MISLCDLVGDRTVLPIISCLYFAICSKYGINSLYGGAGFFVDTCIGDLGGDGATFGGNGVSSNCTGITFCGFGGLFFLTGKLALGILYCLFLLWCDFQSYQDF